ncbi:unnamed protein product [Protopolystoma xenopodis]|uniref:Uncharacterized protein n=1 Tax=Protopolystoma xenopodis TaxID=117903 RepID=A0A3S5AML9_9PLAT|nr:unnamed protein product [Protopolystoma xenopodis]
MCLCSVLTAWMAKCLAILTIHRGVSRLESFH